LPEWFFPGVGLFLEEEMETNTSEIVCRILLSLIFLLWAQHKFKFSWERILTILGGLAATLMTIFLLRPGLNLLVWGAAFFLHHIYMTKKKVT
jgi:uncharacterized membrane protein YhhN